MSSSGVIAVSPTGSYNVVVDISDSFGSRATVYSDATRTASVTLPATVTATTEFFVEPGYYTTSGKVGGTETLGHRDYVGEGCRNAYNAGVAGSVAAASSGGSSSLPVVQLTSTSGWVIGTSQPSAWLDAGSAGGTALTPDAAAGTITVNENGFYLVLARLSAVVCTAAGYLTLDDTNGRFLVDRSLPISTFGATLSISDLVFQTAGTVMALEVYTGDGALAGHGGNIDFYVTQTAKSAI